ncbi:hypothetical protein [Succinimonas amylolytica]|uniref:hypothetical protein n=1 Tax=Succinimonas amylolytica TaxID=83769 RepID=UPI00037B0F2F|nr:hypothetical protein [Succinimonas amylolytica]
MIKCKPKQQEYEVDGFKILYYYRPALLDNSHLIVVFSGFAVPSKLFYPDFMGNSLTDITCSILWIKDYFFNYYSYYLCHNNDFSLSLAVNKFIQSFARALNISKHDISIIGGSKGGTAVLYYAYKFGYRHAISIVPQYCKFPDYLLSSMRTWHRTLLNMFGSEEVSKEYIFSILESAIKQSSYIDYVNFYLIRSDNDNVDTCVELSELLNSYKQARFQEFVINSPLAYKHDKISPYCLSLTKGLLSVISYGYTPSFSSEKKMMAMADDSFGSDCYDIAKHLTKKVQTPVFKAFLYKTDIVLGKGTQSFLKINLLLFINHLDLNFEHEHIILCVNTPSACLKIPCKRSYDKISFEVNRSYFYDSFYDYSSKMYEACIDLGNFCDCQCVSDLTIAIPRCCLASPIFLQNDLYKSLYFYRRNFAMLYPVLDLCNENYSLRINFSFLSNFLYHNILSFSHRLNCFFIVDKEFFVNDDLVFCSEQSLPKSDFGWNAVKIHMPYSQSFYSVIVTDLKIATDSEVHQIDVALFDEESDVVLSNFFKLDICDIIENRFSFVINNGDNLHNVGLAIYAGLHGETQNVALDFSIQIFAKKFEKCI